MIKDDIQNAMYLSMKAGDSVKVKALRYVLSEIKNAEIDKKADLTDEEIISLLQKETKKRKEATQIFRKANRVDLVTDEEKQIEIINQYLPQQLTEQEINNIINTELAAIGANPHEGKLIGIIIARTKGKADGSLIAQLVKRRLLTLDSTIRTLDK